MCNFLRAGLVGAVLLISTAYSQTPLENNEILSNGGLLHSLLAKPVIGQPYSAIQVSSTKQQLAGGTNITHKGHHFVARDAAGRIRVEMRLAKATDDQPEEMLVYVIDPEAHTFTTWATGPDTNKSATVAKIPPVEKSSMAKPASAQANEDNRPQPITTTEYLGTDILGGLPVSAFKTTTIVPAGRSGNDAPITKTHEVWTSSDMKLVMKEQWEDPRTGERTIALEKFSRADPDPSLFRPPADYTVKSVIETLKDLEAKLSAFQN
jgi:hypothetical protein